MFDKILDLLAEKQCPLRRAERILSVLGYGVYGIEHCGLDNVYDDDHYAFTYINTGDTYTSTLAKHDGKILSTTWGDLYESLEHEYQEENNAVSCGYCGGYAELIEGVEWDQTPCDCGHYVNGERI